MLWIELGGSGSICIINIIYIGLAASWSEYFSEMSPTGQGSIDPECVRVRERKKVTPPTHSAGDVVFIPHFQLDRSISMKYFLK